MLVSDTGVLKITDFGIARALDSISRDERYDVVWGSPYYFSPEQARGLPPSPATDIYSLGIIAYEMFTGQLPFEADDSLELSRMHREEFPKSLKKVNSQIPDYLNDLVMKAIDKDPQKRFSDGSTFVSALARFKPVQPAVSDAVIKPKKIHPVKKHISVDSESAPAKKPIRKKQTSYNWTTILLSFLALILAGGLIPFWIYVIFSINR
jgi:serine/threonine-protein kinase